MKNSYDDRIVNYEKVHELTREKLDRFAGIVAPNNGETILDVGAGYGIGTGAIINKYPNVNAKYTVLEKSKVQIELAKTKLKNKVTPDFFSNNISFHNSSIINCGLEKQSFDKITSKSFLHEIPKDEKFTAIKEIFSLLKPGGTYIIWNYVLNAENCDFVRKLVKRKDELAGYDTLVNDRYFLTENELLAHLRQAGFRHIKEEFSYEYHLSTKSRMPDEFNNDINILREWNAYINEMLDNYDEAFRKKLKYRQEGDNIDIYFKEGFYTVK